MLLSVFSINARGIRDQLKRKALFLYCKGKNADFCLIQETHACSSDAKFWKSQWGKEIRLSFGSKRTAGVAILQDRFTGQILEFEKDDCGKWILLVIVNTTSFLFWLTVMPPTTKPTIMYFILY